MGYRDNGKHYLVSPQKVPAGESLIVPDGHTLIVGQGFVIEGLLQLTGSAALYVTA